MMYQVKYKIWIDADGDSFLGNGRFSLLKAVDELGSLSKASKKLEISYKKAWDMIESINDAGQEPLTTTSIGGSGGGGMTITAYGKKMLSQFERLHNDTRDFIDQQQFKN